MEYLDFASDSERELFDRFFGDEDLTEEELEKFEKLYSKLLQRQEKSSKDAKDFGPYWLEGIQGSLAEERRLSNSKKEILYNCQVRNARRTQAARLKALDYLSNPDSLDIKLSELWARYPSLEVYFEFSIQKIVKTNMRLLRSFVLFYYLNPELFPGYIKFLVEEELDFLLSTESFTKNQKIINEILAIRKIFLLNDKETSFCLLRNIYREENLDRWCTTAKKLLSSYQVIYIPKSRTKEKIRRRGYRESHSNKHKSKDQRGEVSMSREAQQLEETKRRIREKQALLFERRLDAFLALEDPNIDPAERKKIFNEILNPVEEQNEKILDSILEGSQSIKEKENKKT